MDAAVLRGVVEVGDAGVGDYCFGRGAAFVYAGAADVFPFDDRGLASGLGECRCEWGAALARPDHDGVVVLSR